ncbi:VP3 [Kummerowia striata gokushovirus]|nr:VP3 [Kummerowia striata gokushovirus]
MSKSASKPKMLLFVGRDPVDVFTANGDPAKAKVDPSYAEDSQILNMLKKFARGEIHSRQPIYADVSEFGDFREMQERTMKLQAEFDKLPASIRALSQNDPGKFADVISDPRNKEFLVKEGFFKQLVSAGEPGGSVGTPGAGSGVQPQVPPASDGDSK